MQKLLPFLAAGTIFIAAACGGDNSATPTLPDAAGEPAAAGQAPANGTVRTTGLSSADPATNATDLVRTVRESVVRIRAGGQARTGAFGSSQTPQGTGTGFVVDGGLIVTNNHVVTLGTEQVAARLEVDLPDGRTLEATLVGRDRETDLAVLKVNANDLKMLRFADPASVIVGQEVFAIGYALDLGSTPTVTKGVVSALDRTIDEQNGVSIGGAIQTDAAINPGNSGGPLINLRGEVVGVNTAGLASSGGTPVQGIFFAVSAQVAEPVVTAIKEKGRVERGFLGISASQINRQLAAARNLGVNEGVGVEAVTNGSPADRAGIRVGDVITKIGDVVVKNRGDLFNALTRYRSGTSVKVEIVRNGAKSTVDVTLVERPS